MIDFTRAQTNLLMYFEECCINHSGHVDSQNMSADEIKQAKKWDDEKFIVFGRLLSAHHRGTTCFGVRLSDDALSVVYKAREERIKRNLLDLAKLTGRRVDPWLRTPQQQAADNRDWLEARLGG